MCIYLAVCVDVCLYFADGSLFSSERLTNVSEREEERRVSPKKVLSKSERGKREPARREERRTEDKSVLLLRNRLAAETNQKRGEREGREGKERFSFFVRLSSC